MAEKRRRFDWEFRRRLSIAAAELKNPLIGQGVERAIGTPPRSCAASSAPPAVDPGAELPPDAVEDALAPPGPAAEPELLRLLGLRASLMDSPLCAVGGREARSGLVDMTVVEQRYRAAAAALAGKSVCRMGAGFHQSPTVKGRG